MYFDTVNGLSVVQGMSFLEGENDIKYHIDTVSGLSVVQGMSCLEGENDIKCLIDIDDGLCSTGFVILGG